MGPGRFTIIPEPTLLFFTCGKENGYMVGGARVKGFQASQFGAIRKALAEILNTQLYNVKI